MSAKIELALQPGHGKARGPVRNLVKAVLSAERASGLVAVAFVDELDMTALNARFRGLDASTDVLSFGQADSGVDWPDPTKGKEADLGEVIVCLPVVERYALEEGGYADTQLAGPSCTGCSTCSATIMRRTVVRCGRASRCYWTSSIVRCGPSTRL